MQASMQSGVGQGSCLFQDVQVCSSPFVHLVGRLNPAVVPLASTANDQASAGELCAYGLGRRRQHQDTAGADPYTPGESLASHPAVRAFAVEHSQQALGCDLTGRSLAINVRRCVDDSDYFLSPHSDCPKTICAILIYLWHGERGTSLYRLTHHNELAPVPEPGLQKRVNNFHGHAEYQRANLDVITMLMPDCFAYYEHVKLIRPRPGSFLFIPNTRFRGALPDLPQSHHGVASQPSDLAAPERRELLLIDVKLSDETPPSLRSRLKERLRHPFRSRQPVR
jgi:hypothetical protein